MIITFRVASPLSCLHRFIVRLPFARPVKAVHNTHLQKQPTRSRHGLPRRRCDFDAARHAHRARRPLDQDPPQGRSPPPWADGESFAGPQAQGARESFPSCSWFLLFDRRRGTPLLGTFFFPGVPAGGPLMPFDWIIQQAEQYVRASRHPAPARSGILPVCRWSHDIVIHVFPRRLRRHKRLSLPSSSLMCPPSA